jgi:hypothetical protein
VSHDEAFVALLAGDPLAAEATLRRWSGRGCVRDGGR